jgi:hypothetical protein
LGDVIDLPSTLTYYYSTTGNLSGNFINLPAEINFLYSSGAAHTYTYATTSGQRTWVSNMQYVLLRPAVGVFTSAMTNAMLIDLSAVTTWTGVKTIDLRGNCGARTSASDAAVATLTANGAAVLTN